MIETTKTNLPAIIVTFLQTPHECDFTADAAAHIARNCKVSMEMLSRVVESCLLQAGKGSNTALGTHLAGVSP
jgi:hypothetical protein